MWAGAMPVWMMWSGSHWRQRCADSSCAYEGLEIDFGRKD